MAKMSAAAVLQEENKRLVAALVKARSEQASMREDYARLTAGLRKQLLDTELRRDAAVTALQVAVEDRNTAVIARDLLLQSETNCRKLLGEAIDLLKRSSTAQAAVGRYSVKLQVERRDWLNRHGGQP